MGNICCTGRDLSSKSLQQQKNTPGGLQTKNAQYYSTRNVFNKNENILQKNQMFTQTDKLYCDLTYAKEAKNVDVLVSYLSNDEHIQTIIDVHHNWCESPQTYGSLACMYMCLLFHKDRDYDQHKFDQLTDKLLKTKVADVIKVNLNHPDMDRQELSVLLVMFLVEDNPRMAQHLLDKGVMQELIPFLNPVNKQNKHPSKQGVNLAAVQSMRELVKGRPLVSESFINTDGIGFIYAILQANSDDNLIYECLILLEEMSQDENQINHKNSFVLRKLGEKGFLPVLQKTQQRASQPVDDHNNEDYDEIVYVRTNVVKFCAFLSDSIVANMAQNSQFHLLQTKQQENFNHNNGIMFS